MRGRLMANPLASKKAIMLDLDGCIYKGDELIEGAADAICRLRDSGKKVLFLTNNSTRTPKQYSQKLHGMGIEASEGEIFTSSTATARYIAEHGGKRCMFIGEVGLRAALEGEGLEAHEASAEDPSGCDYIVSGLDTKVTYAKLAAACFAIQGGAKFIATNPDPNLPVPGGFLPGAGAILSALEAATGRKAIVIGKPSTAIMRMALERLGVTRSEAVMVGDTMKMDILAAKRSGIFSVLVMTGSTTRESLAASRLKPDLVLGSIAELRA